MKIVHTADWHVGKTIRGKHRGEEHREILAELLEFLREEKVDILIIAGDVFDTFTPSAESENIVYQFLHDVSLMKINTIVIAGNHDSGLRFEAISSLMSIAGITMLGFLHSTNEQHQIVIPVTSKQKAQIAIIPFIPERTFVRAEDLLTEEQDTNVNAYSKGMGKILRKFCQPFTRKTVNLVVSHMLMHGAKPGGGERRLYLGDNYAVHPEEIPCNIDYVALGHIHLAQEISAPSPVLYCGSPLQLDFGERETPKGFYFFETGPGSKAEPEFIEFQKGKKLVQLSGSLEEVNTLLESDPSLSDAFLKITLESDSEHHESSYELKKLFPNAVDIRKNYLTTENKTPILPHSTELLPKLYKEFYEEHHKSDMPPKMFEEFHQLYKKCSKMEK